MLGVITGGGTRLKTVAIDILHSLVGAWVGATLMFLLFAVPDLLNRGLEHYLPIEQLVTFVGVTLAGTALLSWWIIPVALCISLFSRPRAAVWRPARSTCMARRSAH